eukprot:TRINITY_DN124868_c0_g1_i1.p1 TRINITY_DN124868_c0_g1~~TRINITY_DN124868_c0_g1_i1.p1  ORF type:complete len:394 (-),score=53.72 TRINITY_DN124868_c0_g1_i1:204-1385(-)
MPLARLPQSFPRIRDAVLADCKSISLGQLLRRTSSDPEACRFTANWLRGQLPVRFARRIKDLWRLPHVVVSNPHINNILESCLETFEAVSTFPEIRNDADEGAFCDIIKQQLALHNSGTRLLAEGYRDVRHLYPDTCLEDFLKTHFTMRIATRILMDNYVDMRSPRQGWLGVVCQNMKPLEVVRELSDELTGLTCSLYGCAPEVQFRGNLDCVLDYIPRHVKYMVRELLKNAFRATVERHQSRSSARAMPPVVVELQQGDLHVIFKISDQGGGMSKQIQQQAWEYGWTSCRPDGYQIEAFQYAEESCSWGRSMEQASSESNSGPKSWLAGYGFGLPLARLHAQYFGGNLFMQAIPGHGTDMYLVLTHLKAGTDATEIADLATSLHSKENVNPM